MNTLLDKLQKINNDTKNITENLNDFESFNFDDKITIMKQKLNDLINETDEIINSDNNLMFEELKELSNDYANLDDKIKQLIVNNTFGDIDDYELLETDITDYDGTDIFVNNYLNISNMYLKFVVTIDNIKNKINMDDTKFNIRNEINHNILIEIKDTKDKFLHFYTQLNNEIKQMKNKLTNKLTNIDKFIFNNYNTNDICFIYPKSNINYHNRIILNPNEKIQVNKYNIDNITTLFNDILQNIQIKQPLIIKYDNITLSDVSKILYGGAYDEIINNELFVIINHISDCNILLNEYYDLISQQILNIITTNNFIKYCGLISTNQIIINMKMYEYLNYEILMKYRHIINYIINKQKQSDLSKQILYFYRYHHITLINVNNIINYLLSEINKTENKIIQINCCKNDVSVCILLFNYFSNILDNYDNSVIKN